MTGLNDENMLVEALRAGVRDFVPKTPELPQPPGADRDPRARSGPHRARAGRVANRRAASTKRGGVSSSTRSPSGNASNRRCGRPRSISGSWSRASRTFAIFTVDPQGRIVSWNPGAERLFGYPEPEILGQHLAFSSRRKTVPRGVPEREIADRRRQGPRIRRALASVQGRRPLLRQRRGHADLRRRQQAARFHQDRARHHRSQTSRRGRPRGGRAAEGHRRDRRRRHHHHRRARQCRIDEPRRRTNLRLHARAKSSATISPC